MPNNRVDRSYDEGSERFRKPKSNPATPDTQSKRNKKIYFDVDGDQSRTISFQYTEDTVESSDSVLTWRGKPEITGADIPIVVVTNELDTLTYFVHREVLLSECHQCTYFLKVLRRKESRDRSKRQRDGKGPSIKIELDEKDAKNLPIILDFMYSKSQFSMRFNQCIHRLKGNRTPNRRNHADDIPVSMSSLSAASSHSLLNLTSRSDSEDSESPSNSFQRSVNTSNAVSLRNLAMRFDNKDLLRAVNKFIQEDLSFQTVSDYMRLATEYRDQRLMTSAKRLYLDNFEQIEPKSVCQLPLSLFKSLVKSFESLDDEENGRYSRRLSVIVCQYLEKHPEEQSISLLLELTDPLIMPHIAAEAAIGFTAIVKDFDVNDSKFCWTGLVRLCQRCAKEVVHEHGWGDFSVEAAIQEYLSKIGLHGEVERYEAQLSPIDSVLFATSFAAALEQAQDDYEEISAAHDELDSMVSLLDQSSSQWEALSQHQEKYIEKQKKSLVAARKEISDLRRQVEELQRKENRHSKACRPPLTSPPPDKPLSNKSPPRSITSHEHKGKERSNTENQLEIPDLDSKPIKTLISPAQLGQLHALRQRRKQDLDLRRNRRRSNVRGGGLGSGERK